MDCPNCVEAGVRLVAADNETGDAVVKLVFVLNDFRQADGKRSFIIDRHLHGTPLCLTEGYFHSEVPGSQRVAQRGFRDAVEYFQSPDKTRWTNQALSYINEHQEHAGLYWHGAQHVERLLSASVPIPSWVCCWRR